MRRIVELDRNICEFLLRRIIQWGVSNIHIQHVLICLDPTASANQHRCPSYLPTPVKMNITIRLGSTGIQIYNFTWKWWVMTHLCMWQYIFPQLKPNISILCFALQRGRIPWNKRLYLFLLNDAPSPCYCIHLNTSGNHHKRKPFGK